MASSAPAIRLQKLAAAVGGGEGGDTVHVVAPCATAGGTGVQNGPWPVRIAGLGAALPAARITNDMVEQLCGAEPGWIHKHQVGINTRHWAAGPSETQSQLGAKAGRAALADAGLSLQDIDLIISASGTFERPIPDTACLIGRELGCTNDRPIPCFSVQATCASFVVAMQIAASMIVSGVHTNILIVSSEVGSVALDKADVHSAALIGDAAAAAVVQRAPADSKSCILAMLQQSWPTGADLATVKGGGSTLPPFSDRHVRAPPCVVPNHTATPGDLTFTMKGSGLIEFSAVKSLGFLEILRPGLSTDLGSIKTVIPHQPSGLAMDMIAPLYGWPPEAIVRTVEKIGNCMAASLPYTLVEAVQTGRVRRGDEVLLIATAAGITGAGIIMIY